MKAFRQFEVRLRPPRGKTSEATSCADPPAKVLYGGQVTQNNPTFLYLRNKGRLDLPGILG